MNKDKLAKISTLFIALVISISSSLVLADIQTKEVQYKQGDTELTGYMAWDTAQKGQRPGVLVVHEWWGHNDYVRQRARDLAKAGYVAFALDMYGDNKLAKHPDDAGKFMKSVMSSYDEMLARFNAGKEQLKNSPYVDADNIAAIGYCFGGAVVLNVARSDNDLAAVVSFHGSLGALKQDDSKITTPILVLNGSDDPMVTDESIQAFKSEMEKRKADYKFISYKDAKHAFTNPAATEAGKKFDLPLEYNAKADRKSWKAMKKFFNQHLKSAPAPMRQKGAGGY